MADEARIHTLEDLTDWQEPGTLLAVVGDPIEHSLSPAMHNAALAELAARDPAFRDWRYLRFRIPADDLPAALPAFHRAGFRGLNLTLPHKVRAFDLIPEISETAQPLGAVNTLLRTAAGFSGTNTDGYGVARAVEAAFGRSIGEREVVLLGAGGAARAVAVEALRAGCRRLWIGNRSPRRLGELTRTLEAAGFESERVCGFLFAEPPRGLPVEPLLINATSSGLKADDPLPLPLDHFGSGAAFYDTTYGARNAWAVACRERSIAYADGLPMLVWQGARSLELWTGAEVPVKTMESAARDALAAR